MSALESGCEYMIVPDYLLTPSHARRLALLAQVHRKAAVQAVIKGLERRAEGAGEAQEGSAEGQQRGCKDLRSQCYPQEERVAQPAPAVLAY